MKKRYTFQPSESVCSTGISFEIDEAGRVSNVQFDGGCDGNLKAIAKLVEGMDAQTLVEKLSGNTCDGKATSCADQLAVAIRDALAAKN